jgi:hypothetical protein
MLLAATVAALFAAHSMVAADRDRARIVLHVVNYSELPRAVLDSAQAEVATIYDRIGVNVVWSGPDLSDDDVHPYTLVILSREKGVKMIARDKLGENVLGLAAKASGRAYIFAHRVRDISVSHGIDFPKLLGKVLAHEVGHLLLTNGHSESGIMRPVVEGWTNASEWFTPSQGITIRTTLGGIANRN